jgi:O-antigen ligase
VELIKEYPFFGTGPGTFAIIFPQFQLPGSSVRFYQAHNDYLHFFAELGVLFVPLVFWILTALFRTGRAKLHSTSRQTWSVTLGAMTGILAILVHSLVDFNLHIPANALLFTVLSAIVVGGPSKVQKK